MKIAVLSDNHTNFQFDVPPADVLIHAGDFSFMGKSGEIQDFINWFKEQPHKHKLWIPGNHELSLEDFPYNIEVIEVETGAICLHNKEHAIAGVNFFGSAMTPSFMNWAFMHNKEQAERYWKYAPKDIDFLVTHGPPLEILDTNLETLGCLGFEDKYDALAVVYKITDQIYKEEF